MKDLRSRLIVVPAVVLAILLSLLYINRGTMEQLAFLRRGSAVQTGLVDQRPFQTAQTLAALAVSAEEQRYAQEAERLADHEVDQAFAMALRKASLQQRVLTGDAAAMSRKVEALKQIVTDDKTHARPA